MMSAALRRILLVEDDLDIQTVARMALEDLGGFEVCVAGSGAEALREGPGFRPDLVLLDVRLPGLDGLETHEALARTPALADVPVVFMTARAQPQEIEEYHRSGALGVIVKPFDPRQLASRVEEIWEHHQSLRPPESRAPER